MNTASNLELEEVLESAGITVAYFDIQGFEDYLNMLEICTELTGQRENYERYGLDVKAEIDAARGPCGRQRARACWSYAPRA